MSDASEITPVPDLRHPHAMTLSDKSVVKVTIAQAFIVAGLVASGSVAWYAEKSAREAHEHNDHIHLEEHFEKVHGAPVGTFDITGPTEQYNRALGALESRVKSIEDGEKDARQQREDRKARYRP